MIAKLGLSQTWTALRRTSRILWVRVALISVLSVLAALSAELIDPLLPQSFKVRLGAEATLPILNVLASSMLAVATFSLGVMVSSHRTLADQSTPRIHQLLMEDTSTQTTVATFIGAFVFALSSIILFRAGYFSDGAAVVVFGFTCLVVLAIVVSLIRWIGQLSRIGSLAYALDRAEQTAEDVLDILRRYPRFGCRSANGPDTPSFDRPIIATASGYVTRFNLGDIQDQAERDDTGVVFSVLPGDPVLEGQTLGHAGAEGDNYSGCVVIARNRTYDQDPRYALQALREAASKALSPGINDPGTAVDVITRLERVLWFGMDREDVETIYDRIFLPDVPDATLIEDSFRDIARDGAGFADVMTRVVEAVRTLGTRLKNPSALELLLHAIDDHAALGLRTQQEKDRYSAVRRLPLDEKDPRAHGSRGQFGK